ncbi:MAG: hypothetical protein U5K73_02470 [Halofilum sp. (in: g-proteobacteria)]|nr:hypothetical protein [Halofilum sp. (in: g-proteobacteria)]
MLQHVLPRRFRRVRDCGFLHGNARRVLTPVRCVLRVRLPAPQERRRTVIICPECRGAMHVIAVYRTATATGIADPTGTPRPPFTPPWRTLNDRR